MKRRLCSSSGGFGIMSVLLLILIPLINSSTAVAGGAPNPMMNITEPLSMSSMTMSMEESAGGDEVLLMMDSEINRMLAGSRPGIVYPAANNRDPTCNQGRGYPYNCQTPKNPNPRHCGVYKRGIVKSPSFLATCPSSFIST